MSALAERVRIAPDPARERGAAMTAAGLTGDGPLKRSGSVAGSLTFMAVPCDICPPAPAARA
ncbi:MAG: hypothetical protein ACRDS0_32435 [Pseudonocardiaceae bacterium]